MAEKSRSIKKHCVKKVSFWKHLRVEYHQLDKPSKGMLYRLSGMIFALAIASSLVLWGIDQAFGTGLGLLLNLFL